MPKIFLKIHQVKSKNQQWKQVSHHFVCLSHYYLKFQVIIPFWSRLPSGSGENFVALVAAIVLRLISASPEAGPVPPE